MLAKGTRDFPPRQELLRQEVMAKMRRVFELYGFAPFDAPIIERYETLAAKFGAGEGSDAMKEIFTLQDQGGRKLGLRFELTFQLARYVAEEKVRMPFKRYQIGRVYRDGPIKLGRYREFWQCDVDTVGCQSLLADAECLAVLRDVAAALDVKIRIEVNSRQLLNDMLIYAKVPEALAKPAMIVLDKAKKIPQAELMQEMAKAGISKESTKAILDLLMSTGTNEELIAMLEGKLGRTKGTAEVRELLMCISQFNVPVSFTPSLVRGLGYYTGPVFEAFLDGSPITSSVAGGGRWDGLIVGYGGQNCPATGISFGFEPIMDELFRRSGDARESPAIAYLVPVALSSDQLVPIAQELRAAGIPADLDLQSRGLSKNLAYVGKQLIPYAIIVGPDELQKGLVRVKTMATGEESLLSLKDWLASRTAGEKMAYKTPDCLHSVK